MGRGSDGVGGDREPEDDGFDDTHAYAAVLSECFGAWV